MFDRTSLPLAFLTIACIPVACAIPTDEPYLALPDDGPYEISPAAPAEQNEGGSTFADRYRNPQEPRYRRLQRERQSQRNRRYDGTPWRDGHPRGTAVFSVGVVNYGEKTDASTPSSIELDDDTTATITRFQFEGFARSERGGGVSLEFTSVDSDLHRGTGGITSSDTDMIDVFGYFAAQPRSAYFRMPTRVGLYINKLNQDDNTDSLDWLTFGARVEVEPEWDLIQSEDLVFSVYGAFAAGFGSTVVDVDSLNEEFYTANARFGIRAGVRLTADRFTSALSFYHTFSHFAESDEEVIGNQVFVVDELDQRQNGIMFTVGVRW